MNIAFQPFLQLLLAAFLGALLGLERRLRGKEAGLRTFALVALGSCFFTITALSAEIVSQASFSPGSVIQAVAIGIGFLGSGLIMRRKSQIGGLTTAAALWTTAALGIGVGMKLYSLSIFGTLLIFILLSVFGFIEDRLFRKSSSHEDK